LLLEGAMQCSRKMVGFILGVIILTAPIRAAAQEVVEQIEIKASYNNGFGYAKTAQTRIVRKDSDYVFCTSKKRDSCNIPIIKEAVDNLVQAVALPPLEKLDVIRLGLNETELKSRAEKAFNSKPKGLKGRWGFNRCGPTLCSGPVYRKAFLKNYTDLKQAQRWFEYYFNSFWTDDYPFFKITLVFQNGETWSIESGDQHQLMLPWQITRNGKVFETFAPEIPRALQLVLPSIDLKKWSDKKEAKALEPQVYNYYRIEMDPYEIWLEYLMIFPVKKDIHLHTLREILGEKMEFIESQFDVYTLHQGDDFWYGTWLKKEARLPFNLDFELNKPGVDPIELYYMALKADKGMRQIERLTWFSAWWNRSKDSVVSIHINEKIIRTTRVVQSNVQYILKALESNGFKTVAGQWKSDHHELISMTVTHSIGEYAQRDKFSEWLILPNGEMILWETNMDKVYEWTRLEYGEISDSKRYKASYHSRKINYLVRINSSGKMTIQRPDS